MDYDEINARLLAVRSEISQHLPWRVDMINDLKRVTDKLVKQDADLCEVFINVIDAVAFAKRVRLGHYKLNNYLPKDYLPGSYTLIKPNYHN